MFRQIRYMPEMSDRTLVTRAHMVAKTIVETLQSEIPVSRFSLSVDPDTLRFTRDQNNLIDSVYQTAFQIVDPDYGKATELIESDFQSSKSGGAARYAEESKGVKIDAVNFHCRKSALRVTASALCYLAEFYNAELVFHLSEPNSQKTIDIKSALSFLKDDWAPQHDVLPAVGYWNRIDFIPRAPQQ